MKKPALHTMAILAATLCLSACAPRQQPFDESAYAHYARTGSATIYGQAYRTLKDNSIQEQNERTVMKLIPVTPYTTEEIQRTYTNATHLVPLDSRLARYVREMHTDDDGNFTFRHVAPGDYYVAFKSIWTYPSTTTDADGNIMSTEAEDHQWIWVKVSVKNGQTVKIDDWNQGK